MKLSQVSLNERIPISFFLASDANGQKMSYLVMLDSNRSSSWRHRPSFCCSIFLSSSANRAKRHEC